MVPVVLLLKYFKVFFLKLAKIVLVDLFRLCWFLKLSTVLSYYVFIVFFHMSGIRLI